MPERQAAVLTERAAVAQIQLVALGAAEKLDGLDPLRRGDLDRVERVQHAGRETSKRGVEREPVHVRRLADNDGRAHPA